MGVVFYHFFHEITRYIKRMGCDACSVYTPLECQEFGINCGFLGADSLQRHAAVLWSIDNTSAVVLFKLAKIFLTFRLISLNYVRLRSWEQFLAKINVSFAGRECWFCRLICHPDAVCVQTCRYRFIPSVNSVWISGYIGVNSWLVGACHNVYGKSCSFRQIVMKLGTCMHDPHQR